jgi:regulator of sigma E protease
MITVLSFIFVIGILIFIHELGHFIAARAVGIRVERFSVGFPPYVFNFRRGQTDYSIGLIPLGGFVKMKGENPDEESTGDKDEFMAKSVGQRATVIFAGPFMNYVLSIFLMMGILFFSGLPMYDLPSTKIEDVSPMGPAALAGLQHNDEIIAINDSAVDSWESLAEMIGRQRGAEISVRWLREGDTIQATMPTVLSTDALGPSGRDSVWVIGITRQPTRYEPQGALDAVTRGFASANLMLYRTLEFLYQYFTLQVRRDMVGGPVFIAQQAGKEASKGVSSLFYFMAFLSVNLAVINVLPIPVLDGGHLVFLAVEKLRGSPLSQRARALAQQAGLVVLLSFIVFVTYNDIMRFFK